MQESTFWAEQASKLDNKQHHESLNFVECTNEVK
jgi:hypothetical protein